MGTGFSFNAYRAASGTELKERLADSGEVFDILKVEQDIAPDGRLLWKLTIHFGDAQDGILYFPQDADNRSEAIGALASGFDAGEIAVQPAVLRSARTRAGRTYYWLADPQGF